LYDDDPFWLSLGYLSGIQDNTLSDSNSEVSLQAANHGRSADAFASISFGSLFEAAGAGYGILRLASRQAAVRNKVQHHRQDHA